eukprot:augustus_masked-scaffold_1-processed-gene-25.71-mRNA-1 protein AED:1.00 eAED:1.00 QI:0/-1/0/0/-1/1/1/0/732
MMAHLQKQNEEVNGSLDIGEMSIFGSDVGPPPKLQDMKPTEPPVQIFQKHTNSEEAKKLNEGGAQEPVVSKDTGKDASMEINKPAEINSLILNGSTEGEPSQDTSAAIEKHDQLKGSSSNFEAIPSQHSVEPISQMEEKIQQGKASEEKEKEIATTESTTLNGTHEVKEASAETVQTEIESSKNKVEKESSPPSRKRVRPENSTSNEVETTDKNIEEVPSALELSINHVVKYLNVVDMNRLSLVSRRVYAALTKTNVWSALFLHVGKNLRGHLDCVTSLAQVHSWVFSGSLDGKVKVWDVNTWKCIRTLCLSQLPLIPNTQQPSFPQIGYNQAAHVTKPVFAVTAVEAGTQFVFFGMDNGYIAKQLLFRKNNGSGAKSNGNTVKPLHAHKGKVNCLKLVDNKLFSGGADTQLAIIDTETLHVFKYVNIHTKPINCFLAANSYPSQFTGTELRLFSGGDDGNVLTFNLTRFRMDSPLIADAEEAREFKEKLFKQGPQSDPESGKSYGRNIKPFLSHKDKVTCMTIHNKTNEPGNERLYTCGWDCYIKMWDVNRLQLLSQIFLNPLSICWDITVRKIDELPHLLCSVRDGELELRSLDDLYLLPGLSVPREEHYRGNFSNVVDGHDMPVKKLLCFKDGSILTASEDWTMKVWKVRTLEDTQAKANEGESKQNVVKEEQEEHKRKREESGSEKPGEPPRKRPSLSPANGSANDPRHKKEQGENTSPTVKIEKEKV